MTGCLGAPMTGAHPRSWGTDQSDAVSPLAGIGGDQNFPLGARTTQGAETSATTVPPIRLPGRTTLPSTAATRWRRASPEREMVGVLGIEGLERNDQGLTAACPVGTST